MKVQKSDGPEPEKADVKDAPAQDLIWAQDEYAPIDQGATGRWALISPDAIIWTDDAEAAGVTWLTQTELATELKSHFALAKHAGMTATMAYELAMRRAGKSLLTKDTGLLENVDKLRIEMIDED